MLVTLDRTNQLDWESIGTLVRREIKKSIDPYIDRTG